MEFLNNLQTTSDVRALSNAITAARAGLYQTGGEFAKNLPAELVEDAKSRGVNLANPETVEKWLSGLNDELKQLTVVTLQLAFEPRGDFKSRLAAWFRRETASPVVLDFDRKPETLGGVIIMKGGKYYDYSVATRLEGLDLHLSS